MADIFPYYNINQMNKRNSRSTNEAPPKSSELPAIATIAHDNQITIIGNSKERTLLRPKQRDSKAKTPIMKTLIKEESSIPFRKTEIRNGPSVVARLMGMDSIPPNRSTVINAKESKVPKQSKPNKNIYIARKDPILDGSPRSAPFRQTKCNLLSYGNNTSINNGSNYISSSNKRLPRQHPQEEVLQKFKKDFEAWQNSKMLEKSKGVIVESGVQKEKFVQILAQENLNKEKMAKYISTQKKEEIILPKNESKMGVQEIILPKNESKVCVNDSEKIVKLKQLKLNKVQLNLNKVKEKRVKLPSHTRIVILKPGFERKTETIQDSSLKSSSSNKMDDFLEEVKERLRLEIEGKSNPNSNSNSNKQKDGKNENTNSTNPKQIARDIAKQIRENVTREMDKKLTRSQPFKLHNFEPDLSNHVTRDTRQILSERLKNVLRKETGTERPKTGTSTEPSRASFLIKSRERVKSMSEFPNIVYIENNKNETRHKLDSIESINADVASPRSLVRSFSAPISCTTLGKLLLEDLNSNSSSNLNSNLEQNEKNEMEVRRSRNGLGLRGRVSNLRGKLFGKKTESVKRINTVDFYPLKVIKTIPSALVNCGNNQENFTEIPPSPASISNSSHNEFSLMENNNASPVSPLEVSSHASRNSFGDLSFKFPGVSPSPPRQVQKEETKEAIIFTEQSENNEIIEILSPEQAYVKEVLVTAGLYENKDDFAPRSLYFQIFTEMEETYNKHRKDFTDQDPEELINPDILMDRKLLFDLANESMQRLYGPLRNSGTLSEWVGKSGRLPGGRLLLDEIWNQMIILSNPPMDEMQTIDNMVGRDVNMDSWISKLYEEKDVLCKRVTFVIFAELMDDFLQEMGCISA